MNPVIEKLMLKYDSGRMHLNDFFGEKKKFTVYKAKKHLWSHVVFLQ